MGGSLGEHSLFFGGGGYCIPLIMGFDCDAVSSLPVSPRDNPDGKMLLTPMLPVGFCAWFSVALSVLSRAPGGGTVGVWVGVLAGVWRDVAVPTTISCRLQPCIWWYNVWHTPASSADYGGVSGISSLPPSFSITCTTPLSPDPDSPPPPLPPPSPAARVCVSVSVVLIER